MDGTLPDDLPLVLDRQARVLAGGRVLLGGDPVRLVRLRTPAPVWSDPRTTGAQRRLARLLVTRGVLHPRPGRARETHDVTVVIPVRDRTESLARCLSALGGRAPVVVVDDASANGDAVGQVCREHGARVVRLAVNAGPAGARNAGLAVTSSSLVAFLDSDCTSPPDWLGQLLGHFDDPTVAAVAPRVRGVGGPSLLGRYSAARCPLDLGDQPARVQPGTAVPYVPTAALLVRRAALPPAPVFDEQLRYGEDVDLVWRLHDAGWTVRFDPELVVLHQEPGRLPEWLARRHAYGTSAAPLAARHGRRLAPLVLSPELLLALLLLAARRPGAAVTALLLPAARLPRALTASGVPRGQAVPAAAALAVDGARRSLLGLATGGAAVTLPVLLTALLCRRTRLPAGAVLLLPPLLDWLHRRPGVGPVRWTGLRLLDDLAYASGVWRGCLRARSTTALRPRLQRRSSTATAPQGTGRAPRLRGSGFDSQHDSKQLD